MYKKLMVFCTCMMFFAPRVIFCQESLPSALYIIQMVDRVLNAPENKNLSVRFVLVDSYGTESMLTGSIIGKGHSKQVLKFSDSTDRQSRGFLSISSDTNYYYIPAFGKPRRISNSMKFMEFAGTDLSYADLIPTSYADAWDPQLIKADSSFYYCSLIPKPETQTDYLKMNFTIKRDNFYPVRIDYFNKNGLHTKTLTNATIVEIKGYLLARESVIENFPNKHKTKITVTQALFNTDIPDSCFTENYLMK